MESERDEHPASLSRVFRTGMLIFLGLLIVLAILAWAMGDTLLPMQYEGFD